MKKIIGVLIVISMLIGGTAYAAESAEEREITVEDVIAISDELPNYDEELDMMAKVIYEEGRGVKNKIERAAVYWVILNRVNVWFEGKEDTTENRKEAITRIIKAPYQFAWNPDADVFEVHRDLAKDVLTRWLLEKQGVTDVGRVIPEDYLWFTGDGVRNWFRKKFCSYGNYWDWSLTDPYTSEE